MSDVKRLLEQATPLPWRKGEGWGLELATIYADVDGWNVSVAIAGQPENAALIVYAANSLTDYEAAVDALGDLCYAAAIIRERGGFTTRLDEQIERARAAIARLRGEK